MMRSFLAILRLIAASQRGGDACTISNVYGRDFDGYGAAADGAGRGGPPYRGGRVGCAGSYRATRSHPGALESQAGSQIADATAPQIRLRGDCGGEPFVYVRGPESAGGQNAGICGDASRGDRPSGPFVG